MDTEKRNSLLFLAIVLMVMLYCNYCMPMFSDDYWYTTIFGQVGTVASINDIFVSQWNHYYTHGGRIIAHFIAQFFLYIGKTYFNFFNALMFVILTSLIYWNAVAHKQKFHWNPWWFVAVVFALWVCLKDFGQTVFWLTGSCNYLWMTTLALSFVSIYRLSLINQASASTPLKTISMLIVGVIAGWTNENTGLTIILVTSAMAFYAHRKGKFQPWMAAGIVGACIGYIMMVTAPGNLVRKEIVFMNVTLYEQLHEAVKTFFSRLIVKQLPIWIPIAFVLYQCKKHNLKSRYPFEFYSMIMFISASIFNNLVMFASPSFPGRAGFASTVFLAITMIQGFYLCHIAGLQLLSARFKNILRITVAAYLIVSAFITTHEYTIIYHEEQLRIASIYEQKAQGIEDIRLEPYSVSGKGILSHVYIADIYFAPTQKTIWANKIFAEYYNVKSAELKYQRFSR